MPKFNVTIDFGLYTEIEPDIYGSHWSGGDAEDIEDNSSFGAGTVEVSGGSVTFMVEAEDEHDALGKAEEVVADGHEVEDNSGLTWVVQDVSVEIEPVEMSKDEALAIVRSLLNRLTENGTLSTEEREAFDVILQDV